ncbi:MAG: VOC family protein [Alteromonadaceae bacterium]|nr:VOC family protein [Alteromonadaceae bacterium]
MKTRIETRFYDQSIAFYTDILGMHVIEKWHKNEDRGVILGICSPMSGAPTLELAFSPHQHNYSGISLQFKVACLTTFTQQLPAAQAYEGPVQRPWGSEYLYLQDPTGIQVIIYEEVPG